MSLSLPVIAFAAGIYCGGWISAHQEQIKDRLRAVADFIDCSCRQKNTTTNPIKGDM